MRRITIRTEDMSAIAVLDDNATADAVWSALPILGRMQRWGEELYFDTPLSLPEAEDAREVLEAGELGYWPVGQAFCIFWGPTPSSQGDEIRAYSPVNVFGRLEADPAVFCETRAGTEIHVERL